MTQHFFFYLFFAYGHKSIDMCSTAYVHCCSQRVISVQRTKLHCDSFCTLVFSWKPPVVYCSISHTWRPLVQHDSGFLTDSKNVSLPHHCIQEEDGWCQRMMTCLLYLDGTAWANLSGLWGTPPCSLPYRAWQEPVVSQNDWGLFFFLFFSCANHFHFCTGVALGICQFLHPWRQYWVFSLIL